MFVETVSEDSPPISLNGTSRRIGECWPLWVWWIWKCCFVAGIRQSIVRDVSLSTAYLTHANAVLSSFVRFPCLFCFLSSFLLSLFSYPFLYWFFWTFPSTGILETRKHDVWETGSVSETSCFLVSRIPDDGKVQKKKTSKPVCYIPSSEPFRIYSFLGLLPLRFSYFLL
jgi:hypothetical protein